MNGKNLNARPASAFNQRPSNIIKSATPSNPYGNNARPSNYSGQVSGNRPSPSSLPNRFSQQNVSSQSTPGSFQSAPSSVNQVSNRAVNANSNRDSKPVMNNNRASAPVSQSDPVSASTMSPDSFVTMLRSMVGPFTILNDSVIQKNLDMAFGVGMSNSDRTIPFETIGYIMFNASYILMGLVLDSDFKDAFMSAVLVEMSLDEKSPEEVKKARKDMSTVDDISHEGYLTIGVTSFMPAVRDHLLRMMDKSFEALSPYADEFDETVDKLTNDYKLELGFIFSNFMYLFRAFGHNGVFVSYVITIVEKMKEIMNKSA